MVPQIPIEQRVAMLERDNHNTTKTLDRMTEKLDALPEKISKVVRDEVEQCREIQTVKIVDKSPHLPSQSPVPAISTATLLALIGVITILGQVIAAIAKAKGLV